VSDPSRVVLSAIFTNDVSLVDEVARLVTEAHFTDPTLRSLYRGALAFRSIADGVLTAVAVSDLVSGSDAGTAALVTETFDALVATPATPADARWAVSRLRADREHWLTQTALADAAEILSGSIADDKADRVWAGPSDAREWASARIAEIASETSLDSSPAGDVSREAQEVIAAYRAARDEDRSRRPRFGLASLDEVTGGLGPGELIVVGAPSGMGKSHTCVHLAYEAAVHQGLSVYFATSETVRAVVRSRILAHHSRHDKFTDERERLGLSHGLDSSLIARGGLDQSHVEFFVRVVADFSALAGSLWLAQVPHGQTVSVLSAQVDARARSRPVDLVIVDYFALFSGGRRFASRREELAEIILAGKHFAVDHDKGRGVPVVTPWQFNRQAKEEMLRSGSLELDGLAETAEIVNTSDMILALAPDGAREGRFANLKLGVLKNRSGTVLVNGDEIGIRVDYATSHFAQRMGADAGGSAYVSNGSGDVDNALAALLG
jgi:replicative DNA helicase